MQAGETLFEIGTDHLAEEQAICFGEKGQVSLRRLSLSPKMKYPNVLSSVALGSALACW